MKRLLAIFLIIIMLMSFIGCTGTKTDNVDISSDVKYVTDCIGREVAIPNEVNRIGCLYAISGHVVTMLGEGDKIVAVNGGLKRDKILTQICPSILDAVEPKSSGSINIEELAKAEPDLVFIESEIALDKKEAEKLDKFNIPYLAIKFTNIEEQQYMINMVAKAIGQEERAAEYIDFYDQCIGLADEKTNQIPLEERVRVYHSVNEATRTDAPDTLPASWSEVAGIINVSVGEKLNLVDSKYFASLEQILFWNPDVIIVNEDGVDNYIRTKEQFREISAVKNNKVYLMPNGVSRWGHPNSVETPLAIIWVGKTIYPEYYEDVDLDTIVKDFYIKFFNYDLTDEMIEKVLSGEQMRINKNQAK